MWLNYMNAEQDDVQLLKNLRILSTSSGKDPASLSSKVLLQSFVQDLSFWEPISASSPFDRSAASSGGGNSKGKRRRNRSKSSNKDNFEAKNKNNMGERNQLGSQESPSTTSSSSLSKPVWKTAVDPTSGQIYYYDAITRKTQWNKPPEVRAWEKKRKAEKKKKMLIFFKEMESNVCASLERGELIPGIPLKETKKEGPPLEPAPMRPAPSRIRTISGMGDVLLAELRDDGNVTQQHASGRHSISSNASSGSRQKYTSNPDKTGRPPLPTSRPSTKSEVENFELSSDDETPRKPLGGSQSKGGGVVVSRPSESDLMGESLLDGSVQAECDFNGLAERQSPPNGHFRRNTGGTIYLQNTMTNPDIKATMKCVCGVYRAHIVQAAERKSTRSPTSVLGPTDDIEVFVDPSHRRGKLNSGVPSLEDVLAFYEEFYRRSRMEHDTIITSLIYVERLVRATNGLISPAPENWRSVLFSCMVLASKVWDDLSMWNVDFSNVSANTLGLSSFTLQRINQLELALLKSLNFDVKVPASEYAKYYFLIRTMLIRSGLVPEVAKPLRKEEAFQNLENITSKYQDTTLVPLKRSRRTRSMDYSFLKWLAEGNSQKQGPVLRDAVCLEQLIS